MAAWYDAKIHLGDAGRGRTACGAREVRVESVVWKNWTFESEKVTCKRCLAFYRRRVREQSNPATQA